MHIAKYPTSYIWNMLRQIFEYDIGKFRFVFWYHSRISWNLYISFWDSCDKLFIHCLCEVMSMFYSWNENKCVHKEDLTAVNLHDGAIKKLLGNTCFIY